MSFRKAQPWRRDPILPLVPAPPSPAPAPALRYLATVDIPECLHISRHCRPGGGDEPIRRHLARGSPTIGVVATLASCEGGGVRDEAGEERRGDRSGFPGLPPHPSMLTPPVVVGYLLYTTVVSEWDSWLELADLGVDPRDRRRGVGTALLRFLRGRLSDRGPVAPRHRIEATVPGRAVGLQVFLRGRGFLAVADAAGRYVGEGDALRMRYEAGSDTGCERTGEGR